MVSETLVPFQGKLSKPEFDGNTRTVVWASGSAREAVESQMSAGDLAASLREISRISIKEIDQLIGELQILRQRLHADGERIERDIRQHAELSEQATQLTKIISDGVKQLPTRA
jgi:DNA repair exonuclease SbcCD ATPase subunit